MIYEDFQKKYPNLFKEYPRSGFDLRPGWENLIDCLCSILENEIQYLPEEIRADVCCAQVKEKFGGLRFYMTNSTPKMDGAITMAESMSYHICETCGKPGIRRSGGWILTLCDEHHDERENNKHKRI
jgi:hypothetical protein